MAFGKEDCPEKMLMAAQLAAFSAQTTNPVVTYAFLLLQAMTRRNLKNQQDDSA